MLKRIGAILLVLVIAVIMFVFTNANPGTVQIDLIFGVVDSSIPLAFTIAFAFGWLFGLACIALYVMRLVNERRQLRRSLRLSESELTSLRNLPMSDAD